MSIFQASHVPASTGTCNLLWLQNAQLLKLGRPYDHRWINSGGFLTFQQVNGSVCLGRIESHCSRDRNAKALLNLPGPLTSSDRLIPFCKKEQIWVPVSFQRRTCSCCFAFPNPKILICSASDFGHDFVRPSFDHCGGQSTMLAPDVQLMVHSPRGPEIDNQSWELR